MALHKHTLLEKYAFTLITILNYICPIQNKGKSSGKIAVLSKMLGCIHYVLWKSKISHKDSR